MPGTQDASRRLRRCPSGLLDRGSSHHPWGVRPGRGNGRFHRTRKRDRPGRFAGREIVPTHKVV